MYRKREDVGKPHFAAYRTPMSNVKLLSRDEKGETCTSYHEDSTGVSEAEKKIRKYTLEARIEEWAREHPGWSSEQY